MGGEEPTHEWVGPGSGFQVFPVKLRSPARGGKGWVSVFLAKRLLVASGGGWISSAQTTQGSLLTDGLLPLPSTVT